MSKCSVHREILDSWIFGLATLDDLDPSHIDDCDACQDAVADASSLRRALQDYVELERSTASTLLEAAPAAPTRHLAGADPNAWRSILPVAAAVFLLISAGIWWTAIDRIGEDRPATRAATYLERIDENLGRERMVAYLNGSQGLFLSLLSSAGECEQGDVAIDAESHMARRLLRQKNLLEPELSRPERADLRPLFDEVELLLLELAGDRKCISRKELEGWQRTVAQRRTLERMNLLQMEGRI